jgi:competence protein ComEC
MRYNFNIFVNGSLSLIIGVVCADSGFGYVGLVIILPLSILFRKRYSLLRGLTVSSLSYIFGLTLVLIQKQNPDVVLTNHSQDSTLSKGYFAKVISQPNLKSGFLQTVLEIRPIQNYELRIKTIAYFPLKTSIDFGDILYVKGSPNHFQPPTVPMGFDYGAYMRSKGITHRHYIKTYKIVGHEKNPLVFYYANRVRNHFEKKIKDFMNPHEAGLMIAMVLGLKDGLDRELRSAYQATGTMHVLAVSGLHVGILFFVMSFFLTPLKKIRGGKVLYVSLSLCLLWFYAVITGLSPSVMRAVTMLSLATLALVFGRQSQVLNTLGLSAFILITLNYKVIYDIGFQYSFAAVLGIVLLFNPLYSVFSFSNKIWDYFWQLFCVSLAAQLATSPLSLYYFHKFPTYFWLANLFVVPLAFFVLASGLLLLSVSGLPSVAWWVGKACNGVVWLMNSVVLNVGKLPNAVVDGFFPSPLMVVLQYVLLCFVFLYFVEKKSLYLNFILVFWLVHISLEAYAAHLKSQSSMVVVGDYRPASGAVVIEKGYSHTLFDSALSAENQEYKLGNFLDFYPKASLHFDDTVLEKNRLFYFRSLKFWHVVSQPHFVPKTVDYVIVGRNGLKKIEPLKNLGCKQIILDPTNSYGYVRKIRQQAQIYGLNVLSVKEQGIWQINL